MVLVKYENNTPEASDLILSSSAVGEVRLPVNETTDLDEGRWVWLENLISTPNWAHLEDQITLMEGVERPPTKPEPTLPPDTTDDAQTEAVPQISGMTAQNAIATIKFISSTDALDLMEEEETNGKARTTVLDAIGARRDELLVQEMGSLEYEPDEQ